MEVVDNYGQATANNAGNDRRRVNILERKLVNRVETRRAANA